ncbi:MAG: hypothetical protein WC549_04695 [Actinomycetota bacterium]
MSDHFIQADLIADFRGGKNTIYESDEIDATQARECLNCNLDRKLGIQPRKGISVQGAFSTTANPITNAFVFTDKNGNEKPVRASGTIMEYFNSYLDTPDWETLETGFTTDKIFGFGNGDTMLYFGNGIEVIRRWTGAIARVDLATTTDTVLGLKAEGVLTTAALLLFTSSGSVVINGTVKTYSGISGLTLTGLSGLVALGLTDGDPVVELPINSGFTSAPLGNIFLIKDSRLLIAGDPANPNNLYGSKVANCLNFAYSTPAVADDGFVVKFWGKPITSLGDKGDYVAVGKKDGYKKLSFVQLGSPTDTSVLTIPSLDSLFEGVGLGSINQKGTLQLNYDFLFSSNQAGIRRITRSQSSNVDAPESLTEAIEDDYENYDQGDVCLGAIKQQVYQGLKSSSKLTGNDLIILKDPRTGFIGNLQGINASCFYVYDNKLYCGDSFTKNSWELNVKDQYADYDGTNFFPYTFRWRSKFFHYNYPHLLKTLGFIWLEGFITPNTSADFKIRFLTENGVQEITETIVGTAQYVNKSSSSALANQKLANKELAWGEDSDLPSGARRFFRMITPEKLGLSQIEWLKIQFEIETSNEGDFIRLTKINPFVFILPVEKTKTNKILTNS